MNYTGNLLGVLSARDSVLYQVYSKVYNPHSPSTVAPAAPPFVCAMQYDTGTRYIGSTMLPVGTIIV
jgi:hypothetical protein